MAASIQMHRLRAPPSTNVSALMVKLTDESLAALKSARSAGQHIRLMVDGQGGTLEIGQGVAKFRFVAQQLPGPTSDAIHWDRSHGYSTVASIATKIQIQATDKTFAETREKAQKMAEEEKKKSTKDVNRRPRDQRAVVHRPVSHSATASRFPTAKPSSSSTSTSASASLQHKPWTDNTSSKISPPKPPTASTTTGQTARPSMSSTLRAELMKKSLRQRVVHAVVLCKYSRDAVLERLRKDGLNDGDEQRVGPIIDEVSESGKDGRLSLKPALYSEVDANKWQWFTTDEKISVKRILSGAASSSSSANFAPSRKSIIAPPQAPAPPSLSTPLDAVAAPSKSSPASKSPANGNVLDELLPPPAKRKREQHTNGAAEKRPPPPPPPPPSHSPPEDPKDSPPSMNASIASMSRPTPSTNWETYYPHIQSDADAQRYYRLFHKDYPLYMTCYKTLADVAKEFSDLERQLSEAPKNTKEHKKVERSIQTKFSHYQKDSDFQRMRQQHGDLRAKLAVLKKRISDWERQSQTQDHPPHPTDSPRLQHVDDLMVM